MMEKKQKQQQKPDRIFFGEPSGIFGSYFNRNAGAEGRERAHKMLAIEKMKNYKKRKNESLK